jgi:N utilization substance protein A
MYIEALDVDDVIAHLLVTEGFTSVEEIAETPIDELNEIEGFEVEISTELQNRARSWLRKQAEELKVKQSELGIADNLMDAEGLLPNQIVRLGEKGIKTLDDLADLAGDELVEILGTDMITLSDANAAILKAREHWFADENKAQEESAQETAD